MLEECYRTGKYVFVFVINGGEFQFFLGFGCTHVGS